MKIRSPAVLDANLNESFRLSPVSGSVTLKLIGSGEATLTLPDDAPELHIHDWIAIYNRRGLLGYYRITNIAPNYKKQTDITMLHGIDILSDCFGQAEIEHCALNVRCIADLYAIRIYREEGIRIDL